MKIKSPLRYPGGKTRAIKYIEPLVPSYTEFREPFVGGGSVFAFLKQKKWDASYWINDLNKDLYFFWKFAQEDIDRFVSAVKQIKENNSSPDDGRRLFKHYKDRWDQFEDFDRAVRFFVLNRITFSGTIDSGGYSKQSFLHRFTDSSIQRLQNLAHILGDVKITNLDYEDIVNAEGQGVFIFLDPPYYSTTSSKLYGKNGDLHTDFDHERFARVMKSCNHKWLITYDDCDEIRELYKFANVKSWTLQYGMNNYKQGKAERGKELFISNYDLDNLSNDNQANLL
jgi:DNA adenine methylase